MILWYSKWWQFIHCSICSLTCDSSGAAWSTPWLQMRLEWPDFKNTPLNYEHTQTSAGTPVILIPHFPSLQRKLELPWGAVPRIHSHRWTALALNSITATSKLYPKLFSPLVHLQDRRWLHPHLDAENQNQPCSQLPAVFKQKSGAHCPNPCSLFSWFTHFAISYL